MRTMRMMVGAVGLVTAFAGVSGAQNLPIVAVLPFNSSDAALGKGLADLAIVDLANTRKYRVVDRGNIKAIMDELDLAKSGAVDPQTAVKIGKILGAHYMVAGSLVTPMGTSKVVQMVAYTINVETSEVSNPQKESGTLDDMFGLINKVNAKLATEMKVSALGGNATKAPATKAPATTGAAVQSGATTKAATPPSPGAPAAQGPVQYKNALSATEFAATVKTKLDFKTAVIYSKGIDALDNKDKKKAAELFQQVLAVNPGFPPAVEYLKKAQTL